MNDKKIFCETCRDYVDFTVKNVSMSGTIKGRRYTYVGNEACCAACGTPLYVPELNDANLNALYDEYRKENEIISLDVVRSIPEKYAIGKRPLSLLLGWGEQTFSRYYDGDVPSKTYSDILLRIAEDPTFYANLLEENKGNLKSQTAYEKSRKAVDLLLNEKNSKAAAALQTGKNGQTGKINLAIQYVLYCCGDITPLALQKALYYIQGFFYAFYQVFPFEEDCEAWVHGPVYRDIYMKYRDYRFDPIEQPPSFDASLLSSEEKAVFDSVIRYICCYSGKVLEQFTHNEKPWLAARGSLPVTAPSKRIIEKNSIGEYFEAMKCKYNMVNPSDIGDYTREMFRRTV